MAEQLALVVVGALASGVLAGGVGMFKWGMSVEKRLLLVEVRTGVSPT